MQQDHHKVIDYQVDFLQKASNLYKKEKISQHQVNELLASLREFKIEEPPEELQMEFDVQNPLDLAGLEEEMRACKTPDNKDFQALKGRINDIVLPEEFDADATLQQITKAITGVEKFSDLSFALYYAKLFQELHYFAVVNFSLPSSEASSAVSSPLKQVKHQRQNRSLDHLNCLYSGPGFTNKDFKGDVNFFINFFNREQAYVKPLVQAAAEAKEQVAAAQKEAKTKVEEAQQQVEELQAQLSAAQAEAKVQAEAKEQVAAAQKKAATLHEQLAEEVPSITSIVVVLTTLALVILAKANILTMPIAAGLIGLAIMCDTLYDKYAKTSKLAAVKDSLNGVLAVNLDKPAAQSLHSPPSHSASITASSPRA